MGRRRRRLLDRGPARRGRPPGARPGVARRHDRRPDPGAVQRPDPRPRVRRRLLRRRRRDRRLLALRRRAAVSARPRRRDAGRRSRPRVRATTPTCASIPGVAGSSRSARTTAPRASPRRPSSRSTSTARTSPRVLADGPGLHGLAAPLARRHDPGLARMGPPGHALGRDTAAHRPDRRGRIARPVRPRRGRPGGVHRPAGVVARRRPAPDQRPDRLVEPVPAGRGSAAGAAGPDGGRVRRSGLDLRSLELRLPARRLDRRDRPVRGPRPDLPRPARTAGRRGRLGLHRARRPPGRSPTRSSRWPVRRPRPRCSSRSTRRPWPRPGCCDGRRRSRSIRAPSRSRSRSTSPRPTGGSRTRSTTRRRTPRSPAPRASGRRSSCDRTAARPRTPRAPSTSGSSC